MAQASKPDVLAEWTSHVHTHNGIEVCMRPLRPDDRDREVAFIASLSERTRYFRLMTPLRYLPPHLLDQLMDVDYNRRMAIVATIDHDGVEEFVGLARYGEGDEPGSVELGITVTDCWQRCGLARLLVTELIRFARFRGFQNMIGMVLPENARMLSFSRNMGFRVSYDPPSHLMRISRDLTEAARALTTQGVQSNALALWFPPKVANGLR